MEQAEQTLHDFVLNLLSDSQALSAFEQDPAAVLDNAGLSGISAVDVQEVIPLVMDYVPAHAQVLDSVLSQLPLDSVDTGQLGAIQQLQFVTQALGGVSGLASFDGNGNFVSNIAGNTVWGDVHETVDGLALTGGVNGTPLGDFALSPLNVGLDGVSTTLWAHNTPLDMGGTDSVPVNVPGLGGLPSGFSSISDVTDMLDGHLNSVTSIVNNNASTASNLLTGAADLTAGALANPTDLAGALSNPAAAVSALTNIAQDYAAYGTSSLPAPANEIAGQAVQTASTTVQGAVGQVTGELQSGPLGDVTSHLPVGEATQALSPVQGVVGQVTGSLGGGALSGLTGHLDPSQATHVVTGALGSVTSTVSGTVDSVTSHSPLTGVTDSGSVSASATASDHAGLVGDLGHVTDILHLPGL